MKLNIEVIAPRSGGDLAACRALRHRVFVDEQSVPEQVERDERDADCTHVLIRDEARAAIATGRLLPEGRIGRMAVDPVWRRMGLGRIVLDLLQACALAAGRSRVSLHAQVSAVRFYTAAGYSRCGDDFVEAGILHTPMDRTLDPQSPGVDALLAAAPTHLPQAPAA